MQNSQISWQVETQGQIYEAEFEELKQWIAEGAVLSSDKVKRGDLRWLPVEKVPELNSFFNSNDFNDASSDIAAANNSAANGEADQNQPASEDLIEEAVWETNGEKVCYLHKEAEAVYACAICKKLLCKACPNSYGGNVKLCPLCGSLCRSADEPHDARKAIGAVSKPYLKVEKSLNGSEKENRSEFQISGFQKAFSESLRDIKNLSLKIVSFIFSRPSKKRR